MKSVATMLIEEFHSLSYASGVSRIILRSVSDEDINPSWKLPPGALRVELQCDGERAKWYSEHLGEYVTLEIRRRD